MPLKSVYGIGLASMVGIHKTCYDNLMIVFQDRGSIAKIR
jgi:hypothetical protein